MKNPWVIGLLGVWVAAVAWGQSGNWPSMDEIRQSYAAGQYQQTLQKIARVTDIKGDAAKSYDPYELYGLRGECQLHLKNIRLSAEAFATAAKAATENSPEALRASATELLVKRSPTQAYVVRHPEDPKNRPAPISILDMETRKQAMAALLRDEIAEDEPKVKAAAAGTSLPPIMDAVNRVIEINVLETTVTGKNAKASEMLLKLGSQTFKLMSEELRRLEKKVMEIHWSARQGGIFPRGLTASDTQSLKEIIAECEQIHDAAAGAGELAKDLGKKDWAFSFMVGQAERVGKHAQMIKDADYGPGQVKTPAGGGRR